MDVLKLDVRHLAAQLDVGEVPEALYPQTDQVVGGVLGHRLGDGQHHHIHRVVLEETVQLGHGIDGHLVDRGADDRGRYIKGGVHCKTALGEREVLQQRMAQIAHADHDEVMVVVHAQDMSDLSLQLLHIVAVPLLAELAEAAEVLPDLRGGDVHLLSQGMGGDPDDAAVAEVRQLTIISGQTPYDGVGDIFFFHVNHSLPNSFCEFILNH